MAFGCVLHLKSECDGCGWCDDCSCRRKVSGDEDENPFEIEEEEG